MTTRLLKVTLLAALGLAPACAVEQGPEDTDATGDVGLGNPKDDSGKAEAYDTTTDNPYTFDSALEDNILTLPRNGAASTAPWAGNYWPTYQDNINFRWDGATTDSPAAKYGKAFGVTGVEDAISTRYGINSQSGTSCTTNAQCATTKGESCAKRTGATTGKCIQTWFGICHAWAPAAIMVAEPRRAVTHNGITFKVNDIKALITLAYDGGLASKFVSLRCNADDQTGGIKYDEYGRPLDRECRYTNAATYHILLANFLGLRGKSFVEDRTMDDEVWNQPLSDFKVDSFAEINASQANALVGAIGGTTSTQTGTVVKSAWRHYGPFTVAAGDSVSAVMTGTAGDADLYLRFGAQPTTSTYACRPYLDGTNERCDTTAPAGATSVYVSVNGYATSTAYSLQLRYGSAPSNYLFNPNATRFFHIKSTVGYISESPANVDGFFGDSLNLSRYRHEDKYEYVLEANSAGKLLGGEWIGASKQAHPDFMWLPTGLSDHTIANGKMTYANIKAIYDKSIDATTTPGTTPTVVNDTATLAKSTWKHYGPFAASQLSAVMTGTTGDADLYVRKGAQPTASAYDCRPYQDGSNEQCDLTGTASYYVSVFGYATTNPFTLKLTYTPTP